MSGSGSVWMEGWGRGWGQGMSGSVTCGAGVARLVHPADEKLQANDGVDDDDKHDQHADVQERHHGLHDGVQHNLETCTGDKHAPVTFESKRAKKDKCWKESVFLKWWLTTHFEGHKVVRLGHIEKMLDIYFEGKNLNQF